MEITQVKSLVPGELDQVNVLYSQLSSTGLHATSEKANNAFNDPGFNLVIAKESNQIVGMGSLVAITFLSSKHANIEDVVVDQRYRGQGLGRRIMERLIELAKEQGIEEIHLTSKPAREAANALYQKLGFTRKETNVYSLPLS
ncbi:MAG: GNAT family N-acetyltransferase [Candidatus Harrisonbacteria bacterium CG10_big_fil_rev_8_21_14_0_10_45_28]|uniref:GNAT family N-acetyltransferase n=1 Tax=Candidatus Harrisonbacteria bacterium CG10_big_fil_rev_8_21_14_0_10_45_28 TaxID=1974586 RepID=A0A2H0UNV2_9BACT|nr:MAG: GNAT family N-acetyltransferase [Candidatus Harrisonbacteria bacterium CG10_big_fil_rev_8_21_14_0_10_45_28]